MCDVEKMSIFFHLNKLKQKKNICGFFDYGNLKMNGVVLHVES